MKEMDYAHDRKICPKRASKKHGIAVENSLIKVSASEMTPSPQTYEEVKK